MTYTVVFETVGILAVASFILVTGHQFQRDLLILQMRWSDYVILTINAFTFLWACVSHLETSTVVLLTFGLPTVASLGVGTFSCEVSCGFLGQLRFEWFFNGLKFILLRWVVLWFVVRWFHWIISVGFVVLFGGVLFSLGEEKQIVFEPIIKDVIDQVEVPGLFFWENEAKVISNGIGPALGRSPRLLGQLGLFWMHINNKNVKINI